MGYAKNKNLYTHAIIVNKKIIKSDEQYTSYCVSKAFDLNDFTSTFYGFKTEGKRWMDLSEGQQNTIVDTLGSWDKQMALDIGKQESGYTLFDLF